MTTQARPRNPRGSGAQLREELIAAARDELLSPHQLSAFSLRGVAKHVGVSPGAVYRHFASVDDLVAAVLDDQEAQLESELGAPDGPVGVEALTRYALRYAEWALAHPGAYQLLFESAELLGQPTGPGTRGWVLIERLAAWLEPSVGARAGELAIRAWVCAHGAASLRLHKPGMPWPASLEDDLRAIAAALLAAPARA